MAERLSGTKSFAESRFWFPNTWTDCMHVYKHMAVCCRFTGDYSGECWSEPDLCLKGATFSFWMRYHERGRRPNVILSSGAQPRVRMQLFIIILPYDAVVQRTTGLYNSVVRYTLHLDVVVLSRDTGQLSVKPGCSQWQRACGLISLTVFGGYAFRTR